LAEQLAAEATRRRRRDRTRHRILIAMDGWELRQLNDAKQTFVKRQFDHGLALSRAAIEAGWIGRAQVRGLYPSGQSAPLISPEWGGALAASCPPHVACLHLLLQAAGQLLFVAEEGIARASDAGIANTPNRRFSSGEDVYWFATPPSNECDAESVGLVRRLNSRGVFSPGFLFGFNQRIEHLLAQPGPEVLAGLCSQIDRLQGAIVEIHDGETFAILSL
jgi:hypothetical protein